MIDSPRPTRPRPPAVRIALIAALCGGAVGLLQVGERRAPPPVPSSLETVGEAVLAADMRYRVALFAQDLAAQCGVLGVASPTVWEERAVAQYERLALRQKPDPAACHRLGIIYAKRGYLRQAREMFMTAASYDEEAGDVYLSLLLVYSDDPIRIAEVGRVSRILRRQPKWLALATLADLAKRIRLPRGERYFEAQSHAQLWRFGTAVSAIFLFGFVVTVTAAMAVLVVGLRAFFQRGRSVSAFAPVGLAAMPWVDLLDVAALAMFCNALGQVARDSLVDVYPAGSPADVGLRAAHALFAVVPSLILVIGRAGRSPFGWAKALGLSSRGLAAHVFQGIVGLGLALAGILVVRDFLIVGLHIMLGGVGLAAATARAMAGPDGGRLLVCVDLLLVVVLAPIIEEVIFRGFIFQALLTRLRPIAAAGLSAILFAGAHVAWEPQAFVTLLFLGLVSAYVCRFSRSLIPSIILHAGYNAMILATILVLRM